jgi:hypothetical protein
MLISMVETEEVLPSLPLNCLRLIPRKDAV